MDIVRTHVRESGHGAPTFFEGLAMTCGVGVLDAFAFGLAALVGCFPVPLEGAIVAAEVG